MNYVIKLNSKISLNIIGYEMSLEKRRLLDKNTEFKKERKIMKK